MEHTVEKLWRKASERFPTSMQALLASFDGDQQTVKNIIRETLSEKDSSTDNDLCHRFVSNRDLSASNRKNRAEGTVALLRTMVHLSELSQLIYSLLQVNPVNSFCLIFNLPLAFVISSLFQDQAQSQRSLDLTSRFSGFQLVADVTLLFFHFSYIAVLHAISPKSVIEPNSIDTVCMYFSAVGRRIQISSSLIRCSHFCFY